MNLFDIKESFYYQNDVNKRNEDLAKMIRSFLIENISRTGGHLSSNLGIVELTIAMHYVFSSPKINSYLMLGISLMCIRF